MQEERFGAANLFPVVIFYCYLYSPDAIERNVFMTTLLARRLALAAAALTITLTAHAQVIITPTLDPISNVDTETTPGVATSTDRLTDSSGLSAPVNTGDTLAQALAANNNAGGGDWYTGQPGGFPSNYYGLSSAPQFVWDLGASTDITSIILWQANSPGSGNQTRDFSLRFSQSNTSGFGSDFNSTLAANNTNAQVFSFARTARFVEMTILSNYYTEVNPSAGGDRVNLGEVRFGAATVPVVVPEAGTFALLATGVALCGIVLRKRK